MNFASKMQQSVTYASHSSMSVSGAITYASQSTISARVEFDRAFVPGPDGNPVECYHVIYSETQIPLGARVWLTGDSTGDNEQSKRVITSRSIPSLRANQFLYEARL